LDFVEFVECFLDINLWTFLISSDLGSLFLTTFPDPSCISPSKNWTTSFMGALLRLLDGCWRLGTPPSMRYLYLFFGLDIEKNRDM
jgi:hypothetical protein